MSKCNFNQQQGVALITVMLIVALIAILATQMTASLQLQMQRTSNIASNQQAYWYAMGAEAFAKNVLRQSLTDNTDVTHLGQMWAQGETSFPVDYGEITGEITDLHSCLNLNALRIASEEANNQGSKKTPVRSAFEELIIALNIEGIGSFEAEYMADALIDWLDANTSITGSGGAEDNDYAAKEFPYLPANNYLASISELRVIEHFNVAVIEALKAHVCVIPNSNIHKINLNTIATDKPEVLVALLGISQNEVIQALSERPEQGFASVDEFFELPVFSKAKITPEKKQQFVVQSEYFKLKTMASFNNSYFALNTIMKVDNKNNIGVITRTIGRE
ncbi:type II secretion system protein K (GspK) [Colwellia chukchiensis]|uniref:Type II secretion system protein K n=1 Tax=Colwellia chukchiensis TaxID=641665 RepID=A0A1H7RAG2_9GAMM|nr:type II secretion system minor pseudopilin GspK [Colwellia chukchiensis]SEL57246.1 type II secretion system protein K (GspK) [Colwellia chukchiensis]